MMHKTFRNSLLGHL